VSVTEFVPATGTRATGSPDVIELRLDAKLEHLPIIRSVAANIAIRADFDLDAIADLKLAVDEASSTVISRAAPDTTLRCQFAVYPTEIRFSAVAHSVNGDQPRRDSFGWQVLNTLTDHAAATVEPVESTTDGPGFRLRIELTKQKTVADG